MVVTGRNILGLLNDLRALAGNRCTKHMQTADNIVNSSIILIVHSSGINT